MAHRWQADAPPKATYSELQTLQPISPRGQYGWHEKCTISEGMANTANKTSAVTRLKKNKFVLVRKFLFKRNAEYTRKAPKIVRRIKRHNRKLAPIATMRDGEVSFWGADSITVFLGGAAGRLTATTLAFWSRETEWVFVGRLANLSPSFHRCRLDWDEAVGFWKKVFKTDALYLFFCLPCKIIKN